MEEADSSCQGNVTCPHSDTVGVDLVVGGVFWEMWHIVQYDHSELCVCLCVCACMCVACVRASTGYETTLL